MKYQKIEDLRIDNDLLQKDLANLLNITQQQYSNIEKGKSEIRAEQLLILSRLYKVSIDYILDNKKSRQNDG